ncbi:2-dehydro-3-deoxy-D-gluconate 5-dehydrogenase [Vibrio aerogenes CECT 7868]|uniref:2-dehydro-3-deoxy-D-gluconate 5-dehydrogenase n=1 Tax=Vibrio aerogenes CECT 7868 TaxID=1216006 RepID=A0A1M5ZT64_9VIBR|nr:2-dehydro-3-deoxy-D-gluconate 5-dehydrogenase KduD [Vibrio aerogenes]SHI27306.1 2-dehydro-3-deoxy-D-gluconate 5-dehydrogenase [Vibrio aerogenes CECT 7868]
MVLKSFSLEGKVALVTGCNSGLGQMIAIALAQAGCDVVGVNRSNRGDTASQIQALGRQYYPVSADLSDSSVVPRAFEEAVAAAGQVDILVNNAGIIRRNEAIDFTEQDWDDVMNTNIKTVFFLCQQAAKHFIARGQGGKIINIASMLSFQGGIRVPSYTASKSGIHGLTKALANEWAAQGINVNAIAPGYMATDNTAPLRADKVRNQEILDRIPAERWGEPTDLAGPVVFLASEASSYINGYTVAVDGGWLAR